jgi:hypothetical protein
MRKHDIALDGGQIWRSNGGVQEVQLVHADHEHE